MTSTTRKVSRVEIFGLARELRNEVYKASQIKSKQTRSAKIEGIKAAVDAMFLSDFIRVDEHDFLHLWIMGLYEEAESILGKK